MKNKIYMCALGILISASILTAEQKAQEVEKIEGVWQVHKASKGAVKDDKMQLNTDKEPDLKKGFKPLFDQTGDDIQILGGTLAYRFEDGVLICNSIKGNKKNSFVATKKNYAGNFILTLEWKWGNKVHGNSGVMIRAGLNDAGRLAGIQLEIDKDPTRGWSAGVYGEGICAWVYSLSREDHAPARQAAQNLYDWNRMTIEYKDGVVKTWVNGVPCANHKWNTKLEDKRRKVSGDQDVIGFQVHTGPVGSEIQFKNINIKEL